MKWSLIRWSVLLLIIVLAAWAGTHTFRDVMELRRLDDSIAEQRTIIASLKDELRKIRTQIDAIDEEMKAMPDSLAPARMGIVTKRAFEIAKQEEIIHGRTTRARARIRNFEKAEGEVRGRMARRGVPAGVSVMLLLVGYVFFSRRRSV